MKPEQDKLERVHSDLRLMELAERNPSLGGRDLLRTIIERGAHPEAHEPPPARDLREALRPRSLDDSDYRTPVEQAQHLNQTSQDLRDLYERGTVLKGDTLVLPAEAHELNEERATPFLTTLAYAQQKIIQPEQAKEFYELARTISGDTADARTELTVFRIYYDRLNRDENGKKLERQDDAGRAQVVERTLTEMRALAQEMAQLETRTSVEAEPLPDAKTPDEEQNHPSFNVAARVIDLRDESLRFPAGLSFVTKERLLTKTLPELDYRLEHGVPREELFHAIDRRISQGDAEVQPDQLKEIGRFLKSYLDERLRDPETRALHESAGFREARSGLIKAKTPRELGLAAEYFLRTNQQRSNALRLHLDDPVHHLPLPQRPLNVRERNLLFYGRAPEHHTPEMRELRIHYGLAKAERAAHLAQLHSGERKPSPALQQLLEELAARHSIKAIRHFQASLLNDQVREPSRLNLYQLNQQIPPHERTYLYETSETMKQVFQRPATNERAQDSNNERASITPPQNSTSLREYLAHMGEIERQLLNAEVQRRTGVNRANEQASLSITEARTLLPQPTQREVRVRASQLAWEKLVPAEVFAPNPLPEALRIGETIAFLQEQLQERARIAQAALDIGKMRNRETTFHTAYDAFAAQTRAAVYQGFERLDEQREALSLRLVGERNTGGLERTSAQSELHTVQATSLTTNQEWRFDSLRDVLAERFNRDSQAHQNVRELQPPPEPARDFER